MPTSSASFVAWLFFSLECSSGQLYSFSSHLRNQTPASRPWLHASVHHPVMYVYWVEGVPGSHQEVHPLVIQPLLLQVVAQVWPQPSLFIPPILSFPPSSLFG